MSKFNYDKRFFFVNEYNEDGIHKQEIYYDDDEQRLREKHHTTKCRGSLYPVKKTVGIEVIECKMCGNLSFNGNYYKEIQDVMNQKELCFSCNFWDGLRRKHKDNPNRFIIDGNHYIKEPDKDKHNSFVGYGGAEFRIKRFGSDEIVITHNLWHQGTIPILFRELMPDNAIFLKDREIHMSQL